MLLSVGKPGIIKSLEESNLISGIIFKLSVNDKLPVKVKAETLASNNQQKRFNTTLLAVGVVILAAVYSYLTR